jgi:hypothetical protein
MRWFFRGCVLTAVCTLLSLGSGCSQSNESEANISGKAPGAGAPTSQADYGAQMKGAMGGNQGYPGADKKK